MFIARLKTYNSSLCLICWKNVNAQVRFQTIPTNMPSKIFEFKLYELFERVPRYTYFPKKKKEKNYGKKS